MCCALPEKVRPHIPWLIIVDFFAFNLGSDSSIMVVGAHLDSVPEGPGINDNGSGSASM